MQHDVSNLQTALAALDRGRGRSYPPELREQIVATTRMLRDGGWTWAAIGEALGMSPKELPRTVRRWEGRSRAASARPVRIVEKPTGPASPLTLMSPTGWRIEGLTVDTAAALLAKLC